MFRRAAALLTACLMAISAAAAADSGGINWAENEKARLCVGSTTAMSGKFFTGMWGATSSDLDVQELLHGYSPVCYDMELSRFRFDHSVVQEALATDDEEGNRTYVLMFYSDLKWSDGTAITAADYAFSILLCMDPAIAETGGTPMDYSWIVGADAYLNHERQTLSGLRVVTDQMLQIQVRAEALPYFYELERLAIHPCPISEIAPGLSVKDDGEGAYLSGKLTAEMINRTVTDPDTGYLSHPRTVSGPYMLTAYEWPTAEFTINPYFKGTEKGVVPRIGTVKFTLAEHGTEREVFGESEPWLLNRVTLAEDIERGMQRQAKGALGMESYARSGLTVIWFCERSQKIQNAAVRKAIACCFDRDRFVQEYTGSNGQRMDGFCGLGQWMYRLASGQMAAPVDDSLPEEERKAAAAAYAALSLDGLTLYACDVRKADSLLEAAGWKRNEKKIRCKTVDGKTEELRLVLGIPESEPAGELLEKHFVQILDMVGIKVTVLPMSMEEIEKAYRGKTETADLIYLGENFSIAFDPEILAPAAESAGGEEYGNLHDVKAELYAMAKDMVRTEPADLLSFMQKWIALQERITETLPLLPVYSNVYFDFFSRELHDYSISQATTWSRAILESYISDAESDGTE